MKQWKPRLTIEVTERQYRVIKHFCEHGMLKPFLGTIIEDITKMLEDHGHKFMLAVLKRKISMKDYLNNGDDKRPETVKYR